MRQHIDVLVESVLGEMASIGFTERGIRERRLILQKIALLHTENGKTCYDPGIIRDFMAQTEERYRNGSLHRNRFILLMKTASYLEEYQENGHFISAGIPAVKNGLNSYYEGILAGIRKHEEWGESSKGNMRQCVMPYLKWLQSEGISSLPELTEHTVRKYVMDLGRRSKPQSVDAIRRQLKKFHIYAYEAGLAENTFQEVLSFTTPSGHHIQKPIPHEEITKVLEAIDRETSIGKRDYAMILMATVLGIRSIDIVTLRLDEIDWTNGEIRMRQTKTGKWLALPLTSDVGEAIRDYLLNARPDSDEAYVFLRTRPPMTRIGNTVPYQVFNAYARKAGLPRMQFHAIRRTLGSSLVVEGVPVTTVAQILGHSDIEPTKQYISLDSTRLKECALGLGGLPAYGGACK